MQNPPGPSPLSDINECASTPCHAHANCTNTPGSYECHCVTGYQGNGTYCGKDKRIVATGYFQPSLKRVNWQVILKIPSIARLIVFCLFVPFPVVCVRVCACVCFDTIQNWSPLSLNPKSWSAPPGTTKGSGDTWSPCKPTESNGTCALGHLTTFTMPVLSTPHVTTKVPQWRSSGLEPTYLGATQIRAGAHEFPVSIVVGGLW